MMESHLRFSIANMLTAMFAIGVVITAMATANQVWRLSSQMSYGRFFSQQFSAQFTAHTEGKGRFGSGLPCSAGASFFTFAYPDTVSPNLFADFACRATSW